MNNRRSPGILHVRVVTEGAVKYEQEIERLQEEVADLRARLILEEVDAELYKWLNSPIPIDKTTEQDRKEFALAITKFIDKKLRN